MAEAELRDPPVRDLTAEDVAREERIERAELNAVTLLRYEQYARALDDDRAFQRR